MCKSLAQCHESNSTMTNAIGSDEKNYISSRRPYDENPLNLEDTLLEENYSDWEPEVESVRKGVNNNSNHSIKITEREKRNGDDLALEIYLDELRKPNYQHLSREEEIILAGRVANGDESARHRLAETNLRFVVYTARKYQDRGLSLLELISAGNRGLVTAVDKFDVSRGYKFISYAVWWIKQGIYEALNEQSGRPAQGQNNLLHALSTMQQELGRNPTVEEIASELGLKEKTVEKKLFKKKAPISIYRELKGYDDTMLLDTLQSNDPTPEEMYDEEERKIMIYKTLKILDERERKIIRLYFGLDEDTESLTLDEIGVIMGVTRERIRQLKKRGLRKIRSFQDFNE